VARDAYEYVREIDYQTYFDSLGAPGTKGGTGQKDLFDFSLRSAKAARDKLTAFLALMPADQVEAARGQAAVLPF
jgi:hypothetical protein